MDKNVNRVCEILRSRAEVGLRKYGVTTERGDLSSAEWLRHLQEELLDGAVYIEAVLSKGWRPISSAPRDGSVFMTFTPDDDQSYQFDTAYWCDDEECFVKLCCGFDRATHWMPLPEPPDGE